MPHDPTLARVSRKAAAQGYTVHELTEGVFTVRERRGRWRRWVTRIMRWEDGKLHPFGKLEEIETWLDRDRRPM